jgi:hypothetical protein
MPMPSCYLSFLLCFGGRNIFCNGHKTMNVHVFRNLSTTKTMSTSFDLWMPRGGMDTCPLIVNYLNVS